MFIFEINKILVTRFVCKVIGSVKTIAHITVKKKDVSL